MSHTPGPWKCVYEDEEIKDMEGVYKVSPFPSGKTWGEVASQYLSNCRVIAAAPELLEALKNLYELWRSQVDWQGELESINKPIEALIARATKEAISDVTNS